MAIGFISIPLTIRYLGPERYGAWVMLGSLLAWLNMTDLGLSNGLTNALTSAVSEKRMDLARTHVSNGLLLLFLSSVVIGSLGAILWPYFDWSALFGVTSPGARAEVGVAAAVLIMIVFAQSPLSVTAKIYNAFHEGRLANYWAMLGSLLGLAALLVVTQSQGGLPLLICTVYGSGLLGSLASACWLFAIHRPELAPSWRSIDLQKIRAITDVGLQFFLLRAMALVTFQTDYFFIGHFLGASHVPQYSVSYSLFSYVSLPQMVASAYLWTAYNEAITLGDIAWVKKTLSCQPASRAVVRRHSGDGSCSHRQAVHSLVGGPGRRAVLVADRMDGRLVLDLRLFERLRMPLRRRLASSPASHLCQRCDMLEHTALLAVGATMGRRRRDCGDCRLLPYFCLRAFVFRLQELARQA